MVFDFLQPVPDEVLSLFAELSSQNLGSKTSFHTKSEFPELAGVRIAIVGVLENRGLSSGKPVNLLHLRKSFYQLFPGNWNTSIVDLGDIEPGNTFADTSYAVREVAATLMKRGIIPIILGGSQELTYSLYRAYDQMEQMVNLVAIDSRFDFGRESDGLSATSYLTRIISDDPSNLFNFTNIGYQTYYNSQEEIDLIEKLYFDAYRLGEVSANISIAEPVFRDADLVSLDLTAVMSAASGNMATFMPNGFSGKEICALARYAGISDRISMLGLFNQGGTPSEAALLAQIIWYFIEGVNYRSNEYPFGTRENFTKYIIPTEDEELVFYKSDKTDRWWIEIPFVPARNNKLKKNTLLPCSYEEYLAACDQEIPERWWKAQRRNAL